MLHVKQPLSPDAVDGCATFWGVNSTDAVAARVAEMLGDFPECSTWTSDQRLCLLFLYLKQAHTHVRPRTAAILMVRNIIFKLDSAVEGDGDSVHKAHERLLRLATRRGDLTKESVPEDVHSFADFCEAVRVWGTVNPEVVVFHRDRVPNCEAVRRQLLGTCYMHGSNVVLHYVVCKHSGQTSHTMVDLVRYMQKYVAGEKLWEHISGNKGGNSVRFMGDLAKAPVISYSAAALELPDADNIVVGLLEKHGPALIAGFKTYPARNGHPKFGEEDVCIERVDDFDEDADKGHAMAIVGWRKETVGDRVQYRYLVQNWWQTRQYFEVTLAYLSSRQAHLAWIAKNISEIPTEYDVTTTLYSENDLEMEDQAEELEV